MVLIENGFKVATVEECHEKFADVFFMKPLNPKGHAVNSHWVVDPKAKLTSAPRESILPARPSLEMKGTHTSIKSIKFFLTNLDLLQALIDSYVSSDEQGIQRNME